MPTRSLDQLAGERPRLGQVEGRTTAAVTGWLTTQSEAFRESITHVAIDPAAAYAAAATAVLPNAQVRGRSLPSGQARR
ncbi:transposase [Tsukamurella sp. NPDC003166]|uniref:transposase n=1 Tax=Tsukamurella sp. NPDC003166 TaxID=3154444 RepID=UPI00339DE652